MNFCNKASKKDVEDTEKGMVEFFETCSDHESASMRLKFLCPWQAFPA
jgi:hypothetical protein